MTIYSWLLVISGALLAGYFVYPNISVLEIENFLNEVTDRGNDYLAAQMDGRVLDDYHGTADLYVVDMSYSVTGMTITKYVQPVSSVVLHPGNLSAMWSFDDADIFISGKFELALEGDSDKGKNFQDFNLTIAGISLRFNIAFGFNRILLPTVKLPTCVCDVRATEVEVEGWLFNQIKPSVEEGIQSQISEQFCLSIQSFIWYIGMAVSSLIGLVILCSVICIRRKKRKLHIVSDKTIIVTKSELNHSTQRGTMEKKS